MAVLGRGGNVAAKKAKATAEGLGDGDWEWSQVDITDKQAVANAAAEGKPPRRHLLDSRHVEDAGRVMDVAAGSHLPTRARASAFGACAAPLRSAPPLSCSAGCSQRRKKPVQKCRWPCALGRGGEAPPRYPASPPSGPTPRRLKQARRCTTRPAGRHTSAVRQPAQSPGKSSRSSSEGMHDGEMGLLSERSTCDLFEGSWMTG